MNEKPQTGGFSFLHLPSRGRVVVSRNDLVEAFLPQILSHVGAHACRQLHPENRGCHPGTNGLERYFQLDGLERYYQLVVSWREGVLERASLPGSHDPFPAVSESAGLSSLQTCAAPPLPSFPREVLSRVTLWLPPSLRAKGTVGHRLCGSSKHQCCSQTLSRKDCATSSRLSAGSRLSRNRWACKQRPVVSRKKR